MKNRIHLGVALLLGSALVLLMMPSTSVSNGSALTDIEELGKKLFFDENLSISLDQSCATCHAPEAGFTGPDSDINAGPAIYPGSIHTKFGNRKPPTAAYGGESPVLFPEEPCFFVGGMFWDGRATGWTLGDPLAEQALGPFLNFLEQAQPNAKLVCLKVKNSDYADDFEDVWGPGSLSCNKDDLASTYEFIGMSISAYEKSIEVNPFSSKYDLAIDDFTQDELAGMALFDGKGKCALCHIRNDVPGEDLFTDFTYDNLGTPRNPQNPFYDAVRKFNPDGEDWIDPGLGGFLANTADYSECAGENYGKHKVPTLRNVDKRPNDDPNFVKAYMHNGVFKSLEEVVHFYNTRDVNSDWRPAEVDENVNDAELGNLGLSFEVDGSCMVFDDLDEIVPATNPAPPCEEELIVTFMKTLSDGYVGEP